MELNIQSVLVAYKLQLNIVNPPDKEINIITIGEGSYERKKL